MPGLILHVVAGLATAAVVYFLFRRRDFSVSAFSGNLLPDIIGALYAAIIIGSINPAVVLHSDPWFSFEKSTAIQAAWVTFQAIFVVAFWIFHTKVRKRKLHYEREGNIAMLLLGYMIHIVMDIYIIEQGVFW
jgi:hypothetical protein